MTSERTRITDAAVMRALAHPVRLELLEHLSNVPGGATATECAAVVGLSPSATSYHLRALAKVGMIHEAPGRGDARERVWRATHDRWEISIEPGASDEDIAAEMALVETHLARQNDRVRRFMAGARDEPREWYEAAIITDSALVITSRELKRLTGQIEELIRPFKKRNRERPPRAARTVSFQLRVVPIDGRE